MPERHHAALKAIVGAKGLVTGTGMDPYLVDWRGRQRGEAIAVVSPATTAEVAETVRYCAREGLSIYPQGGNTGLCAGAVPRQGADGIVLALARLSRIRQIDTVANVVVTEAGVPLAVLENAVAARGRTFPLRLGSEGSAQIGGLIATNAGGTGAVRYGVMRDLVLGLEAVLPDGSVVSRLGGLRKDNRGYDWKHLLIGGEGTLGIVTTAALKLFPRLADEAHALCAVPDPERAVALFARLRDRFDTRVEACELVSGGQFALALKTIEGLGHPLGAVPDWSVLIALGDTDAAAGLEARLVDFLAGAAEDGILTDAVVAKNVAEAEAIWRLRHSLSEANRRGGHGIVFDVAVRISDVPRFVALAFDAAARIAPEAEPFVVSHLGDGNVHIIVMLPRERQPEADRLAAITERLFMAVHDAAVQMSGSFSAEHGIGRKLVAELAHRLDPGELALMQAIKRAIDPDGRMAPGVLLAAPGGDRHEDAAE